jgi:CheY-like chemotaxis protein
MRAGNPSGVVLVVEDEWLVREEIVCQLKAAGWQVLEASTGEVALGLLTDKQRIDVLVTDIQLAGYLSGWDVAEAFRATHPEMPVIYASANTVDRSRTVANSLFFNKPYKSAFFLALSRGIGPYDCRRAT